MDQIFQGIGDAIGSLLRQPAPPLAPSPASAFVIVFTPILFPLAVFTYRVIRPQERIGEVYERNLAEEAMLSEIEAIPHCPTCDRRGAAASGPPGGRGGGRGRRPGQRAHPDHRPHAAPGARPARGALTEPSDP